MNIFEAIILGLVQGLTEFIPVSSSGHLVLLHEAFGLSEGGLTFDIALHVGTLLALILYFWRDIVELTLGLFGKNDKRRLALLLAFATIPAVIAGVLLKESADSVFRSTRLVSMNLIIVALLMILAEHVASRKKQQTPLNQIGPLQAIGMGFAQAVALIPGVSRSGSTITTGLFLGLERVAATRFSFLLAIPITVGAILKVTIDGEFSGAGDEVGVFMTGIITAFISGLFAIRFLLKYLARHSLRVFAYYRIVLGLAVLLFLSLRG